MKRKSALLFFLMLLAAICFGGCGKTGRTPSEPAERAGFVLPYPQFMRDQGMPEQVVLPKKPERVISLTNTPVLALYELGVKQVGIPDTKILDWPEDLRSGAKLFQTGMRTSIDMEAVAALKPDLVVLGLHAKDTYGKQLEREKIPVYYMAAGPTVSYEQVKAMTLCLADAFGKDSKAGEDIRQRFAATEQAMEKARAAYGGRKVMIIQGAPPRLYVQSEAGTVGSMFRLLGFQNVIDRSQGTMFPLNQEEALDYQPDLIVFVTAMGGAEDMQKMMAEEMAVRSSYWNHFAAVREGRILYLPRWYAISGGIEEISQINGLISELGKLKGAAQ